MSVAVGHGVDRRIITFYKDNCEFIKLQSCFLPRSDDNCTHNSNRCKKFSRFLHTQLKSCAGPMQTKLKAEAEYVVLQYAGALQVGY
jgi:hypothetical protein